MSLPVSSPTRRKTGRTTPSPRSVGPSWLRRVRLGGGGESRVNGKILTMLYWIFFVMSGASAPNMIRPDWEGVAAFRGCNIQI